MLVDSEGLSTLWVALSPRQVGLEFIRTLAEYELELVKGQLSSMVPASR